MRLRWQLPAWSPLSIGALLAGFRAAWLTDGSTARRTLETMLRQRYSPRELYLTDSGTSALTLALQAAAGVTSASVALPAYCCYDIATAADGAGVAFLLYDINPGTLSPNLDSLRRALEGGARSVVVAHLYGVPVDLAAVQALAREFGALIIEDAAQGSGCEWRGRPAGAHGALGVLSFGRGKGVTGGKGGALLVNDERLRAAARLAWDAATGQRTPRGSLRDFVMLKAQWLFGRPWLYWIPASLPFLELGQTHYRKPDPIGGITALAAGVLRRSLPMVPAEVLHRRGTARGLLAANHASDTVRVPTEWAVGWLRFPIVLQRTAQIVSTGYHAALGIMNGYPRALSDLEGFGARRVNAEEEFPGARILAERLVTLPTHRFVRSARVPVF